MGGVAGVQWGGGEEGEEEEAGARGGHVAGAGGLLFGTRGKAEAHLREALREGDDGDDGDDGNDEGDEGADQGEGGDKRGEVGADEGGEKEGDTGGEKRGAESKNAPRQPPTTQEGELACCDSRMGASGGRGANWADRANRANPAPSDPAPARQVTFQVTYGVPWGANWANLGGGGGGRSMSQVHHRDHVIGHGWPW